MVTTPAQIDLWLRGSSEHHRLEFKEAKNQFDNTKVSRYCVALANEGGGALSEKKAESASRAIRDSLEAQRIKLGNPAETSLRYRHYLPYWA